MTIKIKKICVVLIDRANYGRIFPLMEKIDNDNSLEMSVICGGSMVLERFGLSVDEVRKDGFNIRAEIFSEVEGSNPTSMSKSVGLSIIDFSEQFKTIQPDLILLIGDRYQALAACVAGSYMNIPVAHIQGGEVSGSIDESTRHAITKLSHLHFPATSRAADYIIRMGENPDYVFNFGCPSGDYIINNNISLPRNIFVEQSVGVDVNPHSPYLLVIYHPVTTELTTQKEQVENLLKALEKINMPTVWIWPNIDAGSDSISKVLRKYRENKKQNWLCLIKNIKPKIFQQVLKNANCLVGNSSSFIRDSSFTGVPVVLVGSRQDGREKSENIIHAKPSEKNIFEAVKFQLKNGVYKSNNLYGNGDASKNIVEVLKKFKPYNQKKISYIHEH